MRRFTLLLMGLLIGTLAYATVNEPAKVSEVTFDKPVTIENSAARVGSIKAATFNSETSWKSGHLSAKAAAGNATAYSRRVAAKAAGTVADYVGSRYAMTHPKAGLCYNSNATVTQLADDSVSISGFIYSDVTVYARLNFADGTFTIYPQHVADVSGNSVSICSVDLDASTYSDSEPITGTIENGNIHIESGFGFFVTAGPQTGAYLSVGLQTYADVVKANGALTNNVIVYDKYYSTNRRSVKASNTWVYVRQISDDRVRVSHMPTNHGYVALEANLNYDKSVTIDPQILFNYSVYGNYSNYAMTETVKDTTVTISATMLSPMTTTWSADDSVRVNLGKWMVASTTGGVSTLFESSALRTTATFEFPTQPEFNLSGSGTESDPYLIKSADDMEALNLAVRNNATYRGAAATDVAGNTYYPVFKGKYFALANDIDYATYKKSVNPVGTNVYRFDGVFDGQNHALNNFSIENYAYDYYGLFAVLGPDATVKNIAYNKVKLSGVGYNVGAVAGRNYGKIDNVTINNVTVATSNKAIYAGAVTGCSYGPISNVTVNKGTAYAYYFVGGVVGRTYADMTNVHATGVTVTATTNSTMLGGIAGYMSNTSEKQARLKMADCSFSGNVYYGGVQLCIGGLVGEAVRTDISNSFATGRILAASSNQVDVGGLVGAALNIKMNDCYFTGTVSNPSCDLVGGLIGKVTTVSSSDSVSVFTNCYAAAFVERATLDSIQGLTGSMTNLTLNNCWFDSQMAGFNHSTYGKKTAEMTTAAGLDGFSSDTWTFTEGLYPRIKAAAESDNAVVSAAPVTLASTDNVLMVKNDFTYSTANNVAWKSVKNGQYDTTGGYAFTFNAGTGKLNWNQYTDTLIVERGNASKVIIMNIAPMPFSGSGTAADPWKIATREDWHSFCEIGTNASLDFADKYLMMTADIDMQGDTITPVSYDNSAKLRFNGNFNGCGHTIDNYVVKTVDFYGPGEAKPEGEVNPKSTASTYYGGLFCAIGENGVVKNLTIGAKANLQAFTYGGAIAGISYGKIDSCANYSSVTTYFSRSGGIAGWLAAGAEVSNCYNAGTILAGYSDAGGIAGYSVGATIKNCANVGTVASAYINTYQTDGKQIQAGGIVGEDAGKNTYENVMNSGTVYSYKTVGGIAGKTAASTKINTAVNYGFVTATNDKTTAGQITGTSTSTTYSNCAYDNQIQKLGAVGNANMNGVTGYKTAELAAGNLENLSADAWTQAKDAYPVINAAANCNEARLASLATIYFADGDNSSYVTRVATLNNATTVAWAAQVGTAFKVDGSTLTPTVPESGVQNDTIVASLNGAKRNIPICTLNANIFEGDGTSTSPYQIATVADVHMLENFIASSGYDYAGAYFKVMNDIDFTGDEFAPVASGTNSFNADFDGAGHTLKNITYDKSAETTNSGAGFFGTVGADGYIHDLTIESSAFGAYNNAAAFVTNLYGKAANLVNKATVKAGVSYAGGIAAKAMTAASFKNCHNYGAVTVKTSYAGGIFGYAAAAAEVNVDSCSNEGLISGTSYLGGIAGDASATYYRCWNKGDVMGTNNYEGGITGYALAPSNISYCHNEGIVEGYYYFGGIVGYVAAHTDPVFAVDSCYNTGMLSTAVTTGAKNYYVGGIMGYGLQGVSIKNCYNTGETAIQDGYKVYYHGGIVGSLTGKTVYRDTIDNCWNTADVEGYNTVGGIAGQFAGDTAAIVTNVWNTGKITATNPTVANAAGLIGYGGYQMSNSWNAGDVEGAGYQAAGLAGYMTGKAYHFANCANYGNITAGGISTGGLVGMGRPDMKDCYNFGTVTGKDNVGGILGKPGNAAASTYYVYIENTYNAGKFSATNGTNTGNITAQNTSCQFLSLGNCWFDNEENAATTYDQTFSTITGLGKRAFTELAIDDAYENQVACYPSLKALREVDYNSFAVAMLLPSEGEKLDSIYSPLTVGTPYNAVWTGTSNLQIDGNTVTPVNSAVGEKATLTLTVGKLTRSYELTLMCEPTGVNHVTTAKEVLSRTYYDLSGRILSNPEQGSVVIERTIYTDGTSSTTKLIK